MEVRIGSQGRIVLPKGLRERMGAEEGAVYQASVEDGRLILETRAALLRRMQAEIGDAINGKRSLTDELIAERRAAARREAEA
jgi:AbrB family looped-hinge helix DNA binding protein